MRIRAAVSGLVIALGVAEAQQPRRVAVEGKVLAVIDGAETSVPIARVSSLAFAGNDDLIVGDGPNFRLLVYSAAGQLLSTHGRQGSGPGEYRVIEWVGRCGEQTLVFDLMQQRFTVLGSALRYAGAFQVPGSPNSLACGANGALVYLNPDFSAPSNGAGSWRPTAAVTILDPSRRETKSVATVPYADLVSVAGSPMFAPGGRQTTLAVLPSGHLLVAPGDASPLLRISPQGEIDARIAHGLPAQRITEATRRASADEFVSRNDDAIVRERLAAQLLRHRYEGAGPSYRRVVADPHGLIWIQVSLVGADSLRVVAIDQQGRTRAERSFPFRGELGAVGRARLAAISEDENGAPVVVLFALNR